jgi:hypothetical protein
MRELRMIIVPSKRSTRIWARDGRGRTALKATLPPEPWDPWAMPKLLEAIGAFVPVRAALVVPETSPSCATRLFPNWFADFGGDGYELQVIGGTSEARHRWWTAR